jgi:hypothetical protein
MLDLQGGAMFPLRSKAYILSLATLCLFVCQGMGAMSPVDDEVGAFLEEQSLDDLLEVQLFDRVQRERDTDQRLYLAQRLGDLYLAKLMEQDATDSLRQEYLLKSQILIGLIPESELLELRLELLIELYKEHEQVADLKRIGLLDTNRASEALVAFQMLSAEFARISLVADSKVEQFNRQAARTSGETQAENEQRLAESRALFSRARFFEAWTGYSKAVLQETKVESSTIKAFGWVLGFDGSLPVLEDTDQDLLEYDHVARSMIGVALCKLQNQEYGAARLWLSTIEESTIAPEFAVQFASKRLLDVFLAQLDWKEAYRQALLLKNASPNSLLGVPQSRLLVIATMENTNNTERGRGGDEGSTELAKLGLEQLVDLGEIGHVIGLLDRFGSLPVIGNGFISRYIRGLSQLSRADETGELAGYAQAAIELNQALETSDVNKYLIHAGDALLKMVYCELRSDRPSSALRTLERQDEFIQTDTQKDEAKWLEILALDAVIRSGQDQMGVKLTKLLGEYIRSNPSSERASKLIVQYALSPYLEDTDAFGGLVIEDATDPLAIPARRKLIQMFYKNPDLASGGESNVGHEIIEHARWIWENETRSFTQVREARERLAVFRIVLIMGLEMDEPDVRFLGGVIERAQKLIDSEPSFDQFRSELVQREVQILLLDGEIDQAGEIAINSGSLNDESRRSVLSMTFGRAHRRFMESMSVPNAQSVVRYGRALLDEYQERVGERLDSRMSLYVESMAYCALYISDQNNDGIMREYALSLGIRVLNDGVPSEYGLIRTGELSEQYGNLDDAYTCWLKLVNTLDTSDMNWHRARYESLRLLKSQDRMKAVTVYQQYVTLYPEGSPAPWGALIKELFRELGGVMP